MSYIAPAGTRLSFMDLALGLGTGLLARGPMEDLRRLLVTHSGQSHCWPVVSGRAAMTVILSSMKMTAPGRRHVIVPAYTCYSVPAAIERAGLEPKIVDIDPRTLSMDLDALRRCDFSTVVAIVTANLYGMPNALHEIESIAASHRVFMLDDAAQSLGATLAGRAVGGFGDAGLYSFDKGKVITTIQGGAIVARTGPLAQSIERQVSTLSAPQISDTSSYALKLGLYALLLRPSMYGFVQRIPGLGLGRTEYETRYPITRYSPLLSGLALRLARRLAAINAVRIRNAARLREALADLPGIRLIETLPDAKPVYTRFPLCVVDPDKRAAVLKSLNAAGIGASASYPEALVDVPQVQRFMAKDHASANGARAIAQTVFTLPTHAYSPPDLAGRVRAIIEQALR